MKYIIGLDQGTTSSRAVIFDENCNIVASRGAEFKQIYPQPGWVEHDPGDILDTQIRSLRQAVEASGIDVNDIEAIGITNQRETTLLWNRRTGEPICNAIVWQCRRSAPLVEQLKADGLSDAIRDRTGLVPDAYFSGTKLRWLLDNMPGAAEKAEAGELCFGTIDSFLAWHLTADHVHVTDATNAARTMLFNIHTQQWDGEMLKMLRIPKQLLPKVVDSSCVIGMLDKAILGREIPIASMAGDQHAALFGQACFTPGMCKNTYGTGCFVLMNTGVTPIRSNNGLLTTLAWRIDNKPVYALEGSVFIGGAVIQWLRDELKLIASAPETEAIASAVSDNGNVYFVPAFTGLGAPHWDMYSRGTLIGLTRGTGKAHIIRAALESIAYQSADVVRSMFDDLGFKAPLMRVDGGASANNFLMQFQSDILDVPVLRPRIIETTAMGAAMLAGRAVGLWNDTQLAALPQIDRRFTPQMDERERSRLLRKWSKAVACGKGWAMDD